MATLTKLSTFNSRVDSLLQGIQDADIPSSDRDLAIRHAVTEYNRDLPREEVYEFAGTGNSYYLLYGNDVDVAESGRDAGIDLTSSGADSKLAVKFTLTRRMEIRQVNLWLSRTGAPAGTIDVAIYTDSSGLPGALVATSSTVDPDGVDGAPLGRYGKVQFPIPAAAIVELEAGTYHAVLESTGYTYANGTTEIILGVDQSSVTNTVSTYNPTTWSAYATDSAGILEVMASLPGWRLSSASIVSVEYPAADLSADETPNLLDDEQWELFRTQAGTWLRLLEHQPASSETVRLTYARPYQWAEATDPQIDTPEYHFEAVCNLAASLACGWLATRYGQKRESSISADSVERRTQADQYLTLAREFRKVYKSLTSQEAGETQAGMAIVDVDLGNAIGDDFIFHRRGSR